MSCPNQSVPATNSAAIVLVLFILLIIVLGASFMC